LARVSSDPLQTTATLPSRVHAPCSDFPYFLFWKPNLQKKDDVKRAELQFMKAISALGSLFLMIRIPVRFAESSPRQSKWH
jgi:hypothetical protein